MPRPPLLPLSALALFAVAIGGCKDLPERLIAENDRVALKAGLEAAEAAGRIEPLDERAVPDGPTLAKILARPLSGATLPPMTLRFTGTYAIEVAGAPPEDAPAEGAPAEGAPGGPDGGPPDAGPPPRAPLPPPRIEETRTLRLGPDGVFAFDLLTTAGGGDLPLADDGRRCVWVDDRFYTAHRHGPYTAFDAVADEHHRCLDGALEPVSTLVRLFAERLQVTADGPVAVLGRDALKVSVRAVEGGQAPPPVDPTYGDDGLTEGDSPAVFGLRAPLVVGYTHVEAFDGHLVLDAESGQPLGGALTVRLPFSKAGRRATLTVSMRLEAEPFEGPIEAPAEARRYGPRQRIFDDRRRILGETPKPAPDEAPTLPAPGDAPRLGIDEDGELRTDGDEPAAVEPADEDAPPEPPVDAPAPPPPPTQVQDEDRPE